MYGLGNHIIAHHSVFSKKNERIRKSDSTRVEGNRVFAAYRAFLKQMQHSFKEETMPFKHVVSYEGKWPILISHEKVHNLKREAKTRDPGGGSKA